MSFLVVYLERFLLHMYLQPVCSKVDAGRRVRRGLDVILPADLEFDLTTSLLC